MVNFPGNHLKFPRIAVILLTVIGMAAVSLVLLSTPEPKSDKLEDLAAFLASRSFRKLPEAKQEEYLKRMRPSRENRGEFRRVAATMTDEQRRAMFENMRILHEKRRVEELRAYFKLSKAEKQEFLDRKIAEQDRRMAEFARRRAERENDGSRDGAARERRPSGEQRAAMRKTRLETTPPEVRDARQRFFQDMWKRRAETGRMPARGGPPL